MAEHAERLTDEQQQAIVRHDLSISLSAGAGCGKTFVLTRRFLSHLEPQANGTSVTDQLGRLVAITFTDRAAREMRQRIRKVCRDRLFQRPESEADHWLMLLRNLDSARICTIHSFCGSLLRSHAVEAELDPHFRTLDETESNALLNRLIADSLRRWLAQEDGLILDLAHRYGLAALQELSFDLLQENTTGQLAAWRNMTPDELVQRWDEFRRDSLPQVVSQHIAGMTEVRQVLTLLKWNEPANEVMLQRRAWLMRYLPNFAEFGDWMAGLEELNEQAKVAGGGTKKSWPDEDDYASIMALFTKLRAKAKKLKEQLAWDAEAARAAADSGLKLLELTARLSDEYERSKRELAALDFNDLISKASRLLSDPQRDDLRKGISERMELVLVDEFQDTDPLQTALVRALCGSGLTDGKLFFVGDHKQSIYRFRGANPQVFHDLTMEVPAAGRLPLSMNFRSQPAILDFVNYLFCERLTHPQPYQPLRPHRRQTTPLPAVEFLWATAPPAEEGDARPAELVDALRRREARWVARRVRQLLDSQQPIVHDEATGPRPAQPGDVAILFRALSNVQYYEAALEDEGVDYYLVGGRAFYSQQEVFDLCNLLRAVSREGDEVGLAGVLRSTFFNLTDETLFWLAQPHGLAAGVASDDVPKELDDEQRRRLRRARHVLRELRDVKDRLPIAELIQQALSMTGFDASITAEFLGERKLANLKKLIDLARNFDQSGVFTLEDYITQLTEFVSKMPKEAPAATQSETSNVVRLMTIHQAKGLEFPVVIVPDINRSVRGGGARAVFDERLGPLVRPNNAAQKPQHAPALEWHRLMNDAEDEEETLRVFYVAVTRAADYLILSAGLQELEDASHPWMQLLAARFDTSTGLPLHPLMPPLLTSLHEQGEYSTPKVRVTLQEPPAASVSQSRATNLLEIAAEADEPRLARVPKLAAGLVAESYARREFSISRLSGALQAAGQDLDELFARTPAHESTTPNEAAELGTLVHAVLEQIDFAAPGNLARLVAHQADVQHEPGYAMQLDVDQAQLILARFLKSPRATALAEARQLLREVEFLVPWPLHEPAIEGGMTLRGFMDCLYQDAAGWHLLDYKTSQITARQAEQVFQQHKLQLYCYALVAEHLLHAPLCEVSLCLLRPGVEFSVPWGNAQRAAAEACVGQALREAAMVK